MLENRDSKLCLHGILVYNVNIQRILAHQTELEYHLNLHRPHVVMIQETRLGNCTEHFVISNYNVVSRRDCKKVANREGALILQRDDSTDWFLSKIEEEERSLHFLTLGIESLFYLRTGIGPALPHTTVLSDYMKRYLNTSSSAREY